MSIQFEEIEGFKTVHFGRFCDHIGEDFPVFEDAARIATVREAFPQPFGQATFQMEMVSPGPQRVLLLDEAKETLLQIQPDRVGFNWRKVASGQAYPPYTEYAPRFESYFDQFVEFCSEEDLGEVLPNLAEVVYVNHLLREEGESIGDLWQSVFCGLEWTYSTEFLQQQPETVTFNRVFELRERPGRLYAEAVTAKHQEFGEIVVFKLTARVVRQRDATTTLLQDLQLAHDWVVHGFTALTERQARLHRWGEQEG